ncbi:MAG: hypothetical protein PUF78_06570, partial [Lachnospiraceae bacterium]|nr:hypothetical protein [Lachnospiraceae bacterium]
MVKFRYQFGADLSCPPKKIIDLPDQTVRLPDLRDAASLLDFSGCITFVSGRDLLNALSFIG